MNRIALPPSTETLIAMLKTKRPYNSEGDKEFVDRFLLPLGVTPDAFGNLWLTIGDAPSILWSSHTDTCHRQDGTQRIVGANGILSLAKGETANCLGADCTAGVWLMTEMIAARIPGTYVFHRGEERGGLGSRYIAEFTPDRLHAINAAIAFDRRGTQSIITHQQGDRCASDAFASSLATCLSLDLQADPTGSFTDTANYTHLVRECSNISVGYDNEHSPIESLDVAHLLALREAVLSADFTKLKFVRQPGETEHYADAYDHYGYGRANRNRLDLYDLTATYPAAVASFLDDLGIEPKDLHDYIGPEAAY